MVRVTAARFAGIQYSTRTLRLNYAPFDDELSERASSSKGEVWDVLTRAVGWPECDDLIVAAKVCW